MEIKRNYNYGGWENCIFISNGSIELIALTDVGPRIIRFGASGGRNLFYEDAKTLGKTGGDEWRSYGGHRLWHAPEENPRTYFPDNCRVEYKMNVDSVVLSQETESLTGIKKEIEITMSEKENMVKILHRIINRNAWDVELAPWALTVMAGNTRAIIPQEPFTSHDDSLLPARPVVLWKYTKMDDARFKWGGKYIQVKQDPSAKSPQKVGARNTAGWMAGYHDGEVFIKRYDYSLYSIYPDMGCNTEIYVDSSIIELETINSLDLIPPGGFIEHTEYWFYFKSIFDETEDSIDKNLQPLAEKTLKLCEF